MTSSNCAQMGTFFMRANIQIRAANAAHVKIIKGDRIMEELKAQQARIDELFRQLTPENQALAISYLETLKADADNPPALSCSQG